MLLAIPSVGSICTLTAKTVKLPCEVPAEVTPLQCSSARFLRSTQSTLRRWLVHAQLPGALSLLTACRSGQRHGIGAPGASRQHAIPGVRATPGA